MLVSRRPGALTAWGNAHLVGSASLDEAAARVVGADALHRVEGIPGEPDPVTVGVALGRLRSLGVTALRLVLPEPGDLAGLPGPARVNAAALAAGCAVLTVAPREVTSYALLPVVAGTGGAGASHAGHDVVRWDVVEVAFSVAPHGLPTLSEADRALSEALTAATRELDALDVARGRDDVTQRLADLDRELRAVELPASLPARAQRLVATASRLLGVLTLAAATDSAAVTAREAVRRTETLRPLRTAVRHALCAAYSAAAEPHGRARDVAR